jgi:group I intron endonuclease
MGIIYKVINKLNKKIYIGKTIYNLDKRKRSHEVSIQKTYFHYALKKYGYNNFLWESIDNCNNDIELCNKEKYYIAKFNSNNKNFGYNLTIGGDGVTGHKQSEKNKKAASKRMIGKKNPMFGLYGKQNPHFGFKHSNETKKKMKKTEEFKQLMRLKQTNRIKSTYEIKKIQIGVLKYIYHIQNNNEEFWGIWDIVNFCKKHNINYKVLRNYFCLSDKFQYKNWIITRKKIPKFSYKYYSNFYCYAYPCHKLDIINCITCYCPYYGRTKFCDSKHCHTCTWPHKPDNYDDIIIVLEKINKGELL